MRYGRWLGGLMAGVAAAGLLAGAAQAQAQKPQYGGNLEIGTVNVTISALSWDPADTAFPWVPSAQQSSFVVDPSGLFDCDGDGRNDLVVRTIYYAPNAVIQYGYFRNILPPPQSSSAADINRDGVVNGADLTLLLVAWAGGG